MENSEVFKTVKLIAAQTIGLDENEIKPESDFINDLGCDSLLLAELLMILEDKFKIRIPDIYAEKIKTVNDVVTYISNFAIAKKV